MPFEQLNLLDSTGDTGPQPRRRPAPRPPRPEPAAVPEVVLPGEVYVEHHYPQGWAFLSEHGADAVAALHVLASQAEVVDGRPVAQASTRGIAAQLGFLSKDSVHRRLRQLRRAGTVEALPPAPGPLDAPMYVLHLDGTGLTVARPGLTVARPGPTDRRP